MAAPISWAVSGSFGWTPVVANGIVYAISNAFVSAFTTNGVFVRQFGPSTLNGEHYGPFIVTDDVLIAVSTTGIHVYRLADGSLQQYISSHFMECSCYLPKTLSLANNTLYVSSDHFPLYAYAARPTTEVTLINPAKVGDGNFRFGFTNTPGATFTAWASTNLALPSANWTRLGYVTQFSSGQYRFTDLQATNHPRRYYRISSP